MLEGVHGTSADQLSAQACLPTLRAHELRDGSVARGLRSAAKGSGRPPVLALRDGMSSLVNAMARPLAPHLHTSTAVRRIERGTAGRYLVQLARGGGLEADAVVLAAPAHASVKPTPDVGCVARRARLEDEAEARGSFALVGNAIGAVGVADCVESGRAAGLRLAVTLSERATGVRRARC